MKKLEAFWQIIGLVLILSLFPFQSASADAGPKLPPVTFDFEFKTQPVEIKNLIMLACSDVQCHEARSTGMFGCNENQNRCWSFWMPDDAPYYKIEVEFSDVVRTSNVFTRKRLSATYNVIVSADDLGVKEIFNSWLDFASPAPYIFVLALLVTLLTETLVVRFFAKRWSVQIKWVKAANFISLPILWFLFPMLPIPLAWVWLVGEIFVITFEAAFLYFTNHKSHLSVRQLGLLSLIMNIASIIAGALGIPLILIGLFLFFAYMPPSILSIIGVLVVIASLFFLLAYLPAKLMGNSNQR